MGRFQKHVPGMHFNHLDISTHLLCTRNRSGDSNTEVNRQSNHWYADSRLRATLAKQTSRHRSHSRNRSMQTNPTMSHAPQRGSHTRRLSASSYARTTAATERPAYNSDDALVEAHSNDRCCREGGHTTPTMGKSTENLNDGVGTEAGHTTLTTGWLKRRPNDSCCRDSGHTTPRMGWSTKNPNGIVDCCHGGRPLNSGNALVEGTVKR